MSHATLPSGFEGLAPFLDWSLPTADERQRKRQASIRAELCALYDAIQPELATILAALDAWPLGELPESHRPLFNIALAIAEIAPNVELYRGDPAVPFAFEESRLTAVHGGQETWRGRHPMADA